MTRRRRRTNLKRLHATVKVDTYQYISTLVGDEYSLGMSLDQLVKEHKMLRNATVSPPLIDSSPRIN